MVNKGKYLPKKGKLRENNSCTARVTCADLYQFQNKFRHQKNELIVRCSTPFATVFQLYRGGQCTYPSFSGVLFSTSTPHSILSKPSAGFPHNHCRNCGERGTNSVAMTIINPWKEYWPSWGSNQRPPVLKFATLPTELWGSTRKMKIVTITIISLEMAELRFQSSTPAINLYLVSLVFCAVSTIFQLFNGDSSQIHVSWTIF